MSFAEGIVCPQASQTCCDTPLLLEIFPRPNFFFSFRGGGCRVGVDGKKLSPGFIIGVKCVVVCRRVGYLLTVKCADVHQGASISATVLEAPATAGCSCCCCHPVYDLPRPLLPGC